MFSTKQRATLLTGVLSALLAVAVIGGCARMAGTNPEGGEESGTVLTLDQTFDRVRGGARLVLRYDRVAQAFIGTVENTTDATLPQVRVEVHLSNGVELGPTPPQDLAPGEQIDVRLNAAGEQFTGWTPHAEVGPQSGAHGGEGSGGEGGGEHGSGGESGGS